MLAAGGVEDVDARVDVVVLSRSQRRAVVPREVGTVELDGIPLSRVRMRCPTTRA